MNYKKIATTISLLSFGATFATPAFAATAFQEQEQAAASQLKQGLAAANKEEKKVIEKIQKNSRYKLISFDKCGNGTTDGSILIYVDKDDYKKVKKEIGTNSEKILAATPVKDFYYKNQKMYVIQAKCEITTDAESKIANFGEYERSVFASGEATN